MKEREFRNDCIKKKLLYDCSTRQEREERLLYLYEQRELLIAWNDWMKNNYPDYIPIPIYIIDKFLSN
jgi:hypothetical protein